MVIDDNINGTVFNVQRFTIHDGPGIRTEFFLKGCPLRCKWCSNPEGIKPYPEVAVHSKMCIGTDVCKQCNEVCPLSDQPIFLVSDKKVIGINRDICNNCLKCASTCPSDAISVYGQKMSVDEVLEKALDDQEYYQDNGGVTFSGGEALIQHHFLRECIDACKLNGIHTCVESALDVPSEHLMDIASRTDLFIFDLKVMNGVKHKTYTGKSNRRILQNAILLANLKLPMVVRIPIIPNYNDDIENITETATFIKSQLGDCIRQVQLLRYRPLGIEKYESLGMPYPMIDTPKLEQSKYDDRINGLAEKMVALGTPAVAGTTKEF